MAAVRQTQGGTAYRRVVEEVRRGGVRVADIAEVTGTSERTVQNWASGTHRPEGDRSERLLELKYVVEQLADVYDDEGIEIWLHTRQKALDARRPLDLLRDGQFEHVLELITRLAGGPRR
jgi:putative toxin-antitoxin system antitoxin component (TIGR02293 family)